MQNNYVIPYVTESNKNGEKSYDIYTRLLKDRIVFLGTEVTDEVANAIVAQLLFLQSQDPEKDITLYINSPGGSVTAGMAIHDTMKFIKNDVSTVCLGMAASMGAFLLSSGTKGKRFCLPNSEVMIHQPLGGARGQATEIEIAANHIIRTKEKLNRLLTQYTYGKKTYEDLIKDTDRDNYLTAEQALEYGLIDEIYESKKD